VTSKKVKSKKLKSELRSRNDDCKTLVDYVYALTREVITSTYIPPTFIPRSGDVVDFGVRHEVDGRQLPALCNVTGVVWPAHGGSNSRVRVFVTE